MTHDPNMRVSNAEREAIIAKLHAATEEGRLDLDEFADRSRQAYEARTYGEVERLLADLPDTGGTLAVPAAKRPLPQGPAELRLKPTGSSVVRGRLGRPAEDLRQRHRLLGETRLPARGDPHRHGRSRREAPRLLAHRRAARRRVRRGREHGSLRQFHAQPRHLQGRHGNSLLRRGQGDGQFRDFPPRTPIPLVALVIGHSDVLVIH